MIIVCPECGAKNRVPEDKLSANPACGQCHQALIPLAPIELNEQNFSNFIQNSDLPILIDLWADWCGPCKMMAPVVESLAEKYAGKIDFYKVDIDQESELASVFGIRSIPTFLFIPVKGKPSVQMGAMQKEDFEERIKKIKIK